MTSDQTGYSRLGDEKKARELFTHVTELGSDDMITLNDKGAAYYAARMRDQSFQAYNRALSLYPDDAIAYYDLEAIYSLENDKVRSLQNLKKPIEPDVSQKKKTKTDLIMIMSGIVRNLEI